MIESNKPHSIHASLIKFCNIRILRYQLLNHRISVPEYFIEQFCRLILVMCLSYMYSFAAAFFDGFYNKTAMALYKGIESGEICLRRYLDYFPSIIFLIYLICLILIRIYLRYFFNKYFTPIHGQSWYTYELISSKVV